MNFKIVAILACLFCSTLNAQTEFASGLVVNFPFGDEYDKTGTGFDLKGISYLNDLGGMRIGIAYLGHPKGSASIPAYAIDNSSVSNDTILVPHVVKRQAYRLDMQYFRLLSNGYNNDMNFYTYGGLRFNMTNQRYKPENYSEDVYVLQTGQANNGIDLHTRGSVGFGYEIALDFFDFVYLEIETSFPLFKITDKPYIPNNKWSLGINLGFRTNFSN